MNSDSLMHRSTIYPTDIKLFLQFSQHTHTHKSIIKTSAATDAERTTSEQVDKLNIKNALQNRQTFSEKDIN